MGKKKAGRSSKASKNSGSRSGLCTKTTPPEHRTTASQALQTCIEPMVSSGNKAVSPSSPASSRHRNLLERSLSEHRIQGMLRRPSSNSAQSRASETSNIANVLSQYMHELENDDESGIMASRYYGNMADLPENADRPLMPMNSTLPLFSPSVANRRSIHRVHTAGSSGAGSNGAARGRMNRAVTDVRAKEDRGEPDVSPMSDPAQMHGWMGKSVDESMGAEIRKVVNAGRSLSMGGGGQTGSNVATVPESLVPVSSAPETSAPESLVAEADRTPPEGSSSQTAGHDVKQPESEHSRDPSDTLPMVPSRLFAMHERDDAIGLGVVENQQRPRRSINTMGATQYKPAASSKRTAMARAAPGLSYMFSPALSGSRPASVAGGSVPGALNLGEQTESGFHRDPVGQNPLTRSPNEEMASESRKIDGGVNVSVLEQFLLTGEVPDSTSEEDDDETASDSSWNEYSEPESVFGGNIADGTGLAQQDTTKGAKESKVMHTVPGSYKSMLNHIPAASGRANRSSISSEREPLLQRAATMSPQGYMSDPNFIPADLPPIAEPTQRARVSPPDRNRRTFDVQPVEKQKRRRRRKRMYQEELFLDKDGFIDESYRFTFFNPAIGTVRSQELADLRTPAMDLASMIQAGGCFWIDVLRPSFQEMHLISKIFGIHALTVEDIMTQDVREKCEVHANYYLVSFRSFDADPNSESYLEPKCIYNVVMRSGIITFHMDPSVHQYHVLRRIRRQIDHIVVTPDWLNYAIIDDITDLLAPIMQMIEFEVDTIDELVLVISSSEQSDMLLRISTVRKRIMMVLRLLQGKADVVRALIKRFETATAMTTSQMNAMAGNPPLPGYAVAAADYSPRNHGSEPMAAYPIDNTDTAMEVAIDQRKGHEVLLYLGDVLDHIVTMTQNATHYDGVLGRAHANYLAQISIELTVSSNRTNDVVAKLSALAAIVVPLNFVTGMFGSNFLVPFQNYDGLAPFFTVLAMCLGFVVIVFGWARWKQIL